MNIIRWLGFPFRLVVFAVCISFFGLLGIVGLAIFDPCELPRAWRHVTETWQWVWNPADPTDHDIY